MPIKGLSEIRRLPRLGKIHLGHKDPQRGFPVRDDYFVFPKDMPAVKQKFGEMPRALEIIIPAEDEEFWCPQYYRNYSASQGLVCKGDGETAQAKIDTDTGALADRNTKSFKLTSCSCPGRQCPEYIHKRCREVMNLQFLLPTIPGLGIWQIDTSSVNSIININSCAQLIRGLFGRVYNIPLLLTLEPKEVSNPETGKRQTVYVLNLRHRGTLAELVKEAQSLTGLLEIDRALLPPADDAEPPEDSNLPENEAPTGTTALPGEEPNEPDPQDPFAEETGAPADDNNIPASDEDLNALANAQISYGYINSELKRIVPPEWKVKNRNDLTRSQVNALIKVMRIKPIRPGNYTK